MNYTNIVVISYLSQKKDPFFVTEKIISEKVSKVI